MVQRLLNAGHDLRILLTFPAGEELVGASALGATSSCDLDCHDGGPWRRPRRSLLLDFKKVSKLPDRRIVLTASCCE